jgi:hypothetical protein
MLNMIFNLVVPAKAGTSWNSYSGVDKEIPAFAGMTECK